MANTDKFLKPRLPEKRKRGEKVDTEEYLDTKRLEFSIVFNIRGDGAERKMESFIERVVVPLKEKYPYAEICIEVNG